MKLPKRQKATTPTFQEIPIDKVLDPERPIRSDMTPETVRELVNSIREIGIIEPLVLKEVNDHFEVVAGHRRLFAAEIAELTRVPAMIVNSDKETSALIMLHENLHRRDLNPVDEARYLAYMKNEFQLSNVELGNRIGKSEAYVRSRLEVLTYPPELFDALRDGQVNVSVAREFAKITDEITRRDYLGHAIQSGITPAVAKQWRRNFEYQKELQNHTPTPDNPTPPEPPEKPPALACPLCLAEVKPYEAVPLHVHKECAGLLDRKLSSEKAGLAAGEPAAST